MGATNHPWEVDVLGIASDLGQRWAASPQAGFSLSLVALLLIVSSFAWPLARLLARRLRRRS
jgi:hypothetical protein